MKRREFLKILNNAGFSLSAFAFFPSLSWAAKEHKLQGKLYTIGENYNGGAAHSVVTKIDLSSQKSIQKTIPISWGHLVNRYQENEVIACGYHSDYLLVLDDDTLKEKRKIQMPPSYHSSGHFLIHKKKIYIGLYPKDYGGSAGLAIIDLKSENLLKLLSFPTYGCHDVDLLDANHILVSLTPRKNKKGFLYPDEKGAIAIINTTTNTQESYIKVSAAGSPDHLGVSQNGHFYAGMTQYIPFSNKEFLTDYFKKPFEEFKKGLNETALRQNKIALHCPLVSYNSHHLKGSKPKSLNFLPGEQRKLLSFAQDLNSNRMYVTCGHSNKLICFDPETGKFIKSWDGKQMGLKSLQGVCTLNDELIALSGDKENIVIYSIKNDRIYHTYPLQLHSSTHLSFDATKS